MVDRAFADAAIQHYLSGKDVVVLAMLGTSGGPLATPMWFVNDEHELAMVSVGGLRLRDSLTPGPRLRSG